MKIGIMVTTHADYGGPLHHILPSVEVFPDRIIVSGGHESRFLYQRMKTPIIETTHDSYDYTGLIEIVQSPQDFPADWTHVLCIQDTMELGKRTLELCKAADPDVEATAAADGLCNLVLYRIDYLHRMKEFILARMNCGKKDSILYEGALWQQSTNRRSFHQSGVFRCGEGFPYSRVHRIKEHYPSLDLAKWKANYGQNMNNLIKNP